MADIRKRPAKPERVAPGEMLNEQQQEELISKFQKHDDWLNFLYKMAMTALALFLLFWQQKQEYSIGSGLVCIASPCLLWALDVVGMEAITSTGYHSSLLLNGLVSLVVGFQYGTWLGWAPFGLQLLLIMMVRDMYQTNQGLQQLQTNRYKFKGA
ncbi:hypothetical protein HDU91_006509 [Kappamyces sp. JEL0680]|nr:hypothetical protein HDU91_006509 [Kappamyces sp. JEL0680]